MPKEDTAGGCWESLAGRVTGRGPWERILRYTLADVDGRFETYISLYCFLLPCFYCQPARAACITDPFYLQMLGGSRMTFEPRLALAHRSRLVQSDENE